MGYVFKHECGSRSKLRFMSFDLLIESKNVSYALAMCSCSRKQQMDACKCNETNVTIAMNVDVCGKIRDIFASWSSCSAYFETVLR